MSAFAPPVSAASLPSYDHVFVIAMENHSYGEIIGNPAAPYINSLTAAGGLATNYFAAGHPSLPNYLALTGGSTYGVTSDCTTCWVAAPNIADKLEAAGKTWKAYQESMPSACLVGDSYPYVQKHNPLIYFNDIRTNASRCQSHVVPYSQLSGDLGSAATTPNYAFITPNMSNDMHDGSIQAGDAWLQQQVPHILGSPAFTAQRSLLTIVWDEDDGSASNQVAMILVGTGITPGYRSTAGYNHYSLLHTVEAGLGLPTLTNNDAAAAVMSDFVGATSGCAVTLTTPASAATTQFNVSVSVPGCSAPWFDVQQLDTTLNQVWSDVGSGSSSGGSGTAVADGYAGHSYQLRARARASSGGVSAWSSTTTTQISTSAAASLPFKGLYTLDGFGGVHPDDSGPLMPSATWPGWAIARAAHTQPGGSAPQSGFVLDGYGGLHPYGAAGLGETSGAAGHYWGFNIARDFAFLPDGSGGLVVDGFGGLHGFGVNGGAAPVPAGYSYFGFDVAIKVVIAADGKGGYTLDAYGGLHRFGIGAAGPQTAPVAQTGYWGWRAAQDIALVPGQGGGYSGYVLDKFGGLHPFAPGGTALPSPISTSYFGFDVARGVFLLPSPSTAGYTLDGYGGVHPFGGAPRLPNHPYWAGWDIATTIWGA